MKRTTWLILSLAVAVLVACTPATPPTSHSTPVPRETETFPIAVPSIAPDSTATTPAVVPTAAVPTPAERCPTAGDGFELHVSTADGYCLLYPADAVVVPQRFIVINPSSATADTLGDAWVDIQVEPAAGRDAAQVADARIAEAGEGFGILRSEILLGGQPAVVVDGLPAPDSWRTVFVANDDRLYTLTFQPWFPSTDPAQPTPLENLYTTVVDTIHFLPW